MTLEEALRRPFNFVWPLLFGSKKVARAKKIAQGLDVTEAGRLRITHLDREFGCLYLAVYSATKKKAWWVNFGNYDVSVFDFNMLPNMYIEFEYHPEGIRGVVERRPYDYSSYLSIANLTSVE